MALSSTSQWTLVACGIVAHADGVLDGAECDRLMSLVEHEADADEYATWLGTISDAEELEQMLETMDPPPVEDHRDILEEAWTLSIIDGDRCDAELAALERIANRLGVEPVQLEYWKEAWNTAQRDLAQTATAALHLLLSGGSAVPEDERGLVEDVVHQLPTTHQHRGQLIRSANKPVDADDVRRRIGALGRRKRNWLLHLIAPATKRSSRPEALDGFRDLALDAGLEASDAQSILDDA